ncbi:cell division protein SepF [Ihubacter sp. rT4E-8]|uniref:cell division protein SepF n=1 Tax=unclassified Ihubacter TaxID=2633299 RepID=UPI001379707F
MGIADSIKKVIGIEELDEDEMITEEEVIAAKEKLAKEPPQRRSYSDTSSGHEKKPYTPASSKTQEKRFSVANTSAFKLVLIEPKAFEECPKLVDSLKGRRPIIINLEKLETEVARKIFDFMSGATYALNGNVQKVANNIFIFAPENVDIAASQDERTSFDFGAEEKSPWR